MRPDLSRMALLFILCLTAGSAQAVASEEAEGQEQTLDALTIEGVVESPELLFINGREPERLESSYGWILLGMAGWLEAEPPAATVLEPSPAATAVDRASNPSKE